MMRGWVAISVTATPAAAPRRIREVLRMIIRGYPFHPSEQDMISAAGIKDQELTIIVSMMLIKFAPVVAGISISRLISSALRCLAQSGSSCWSRCLSSSRLVGATGGRTLKGDAMVILPGLALVSAGACTTASVAIL